MVKIRLTKTGSRNEKKFRIIVTPAATKRNGKFLEILGYFLPNKNNEFKINLERYNFWIASGAQPTKAVLKLFEGQAKKNAKSRS